MDFKVYINHVDAHLHNNISWV